jgi:hypothetical protein
MNARLTVGRFVEIDCAVPHEKEEVEFRQDFGATVAGGCSEAWGQPPSSRPLLHYQYLLYVVVQFSNYPVPRSGNVIC